MPAMLSANHMRSAIVEHTTIITYLSHAVTRQEHADRP